MIRHGREEDRLALGRIYAEAWKAAYRGNVPDEFLDSLTAEKAAPPPGAVNGRSCLVYEADGMVAGLVNFGPGRDAGDEDKAEIRSIYILPEFWRGGIGSRLFDGAQEALRQAGYTRLFLWVLAENARARAFYARMGMSECDRRSIVIAGKELEEVRYEKDI